MLQVIQGPSATITVKIQGLQGLGLVLELAFTWLSATFEGWIIDFMNMIDRVNTATLTHCIYVPVSGVPNLGIYLRDKTVIRLLKNFFLSVFL